MITHLWHTILDMPKYDEDWHRNDMKDELKELDEARGFVETWSEVSDVVYTYTRAKWSGHKKIQRPLSVRKYVWGWLYMIPKYTLRWLLFYTLGKRLGINHKVTEVRNPKKIHKLHDIAERNGIDLHDFEEETRKLLKRWPLLK